MWGDPKNCKFLHSQVLRKSETVSDVQFTGNPFLLLCKGFIDAL